MTMLKALHPRDYEHRQYAFRKEDGRGFTGIKDSVDASILQPEDYIKSAEEDWLQSPKTI